MRAVSHSSSITSSWRSSLTDCGIAVGGVALMVLFRWALDRKLGDDHPYAFFYVAIMFAAWFGGLVPGALTLLLGAVAGTFFFIHPRHSFLLHSFSDVVSFAIYVMVGTAAVAFSEIHRTARRRAEHIAEQLRLHEQELEREIAERRDVEESLRASEERFRRLADSNIIGVITADEHDHIISANDEFLRMLGYTRAEFERRKPRWPDLTPPRYADVDTKAMRQLEQFGSCAPYEKEYLHKDGTAVPVLIGGARFKPPAKGGIAFVLDLTDLTRAKQTLQTQSHVLESMAEGVVVAEDDYRIAFTNSAADEMFGYDRRELIGQDVWRLSTLSEAERKDLIEEVQLAMRVRGSWSGELHNRRKNGSAFTADARVTRITSGGKNYWIYVQQDVTQRKSAEAAVRQAEERLALAMAAASMGTWELDVQADLLTASSQVRALVPDANRRPVHMEEFYKSLHPDDRQSVRDAIDDALAGRREYDIEFRGLRPDGQVRWLYARGKVFRDEDARPLRITGVTLDITERRAIEQSLRASEERFRLAAEAVAAIIFDWDLEADCIFRSPAVAKVIGFTPEETDTRSDWWFGRIHPDDVDTMRAEVNHAIVGANAYSVEYRILHRDGHWVPVWSRGLIVRDETGKAMRIVGSTMDVSERRTAEEQLVRRQRELQTLVENSPDMIARLDRELRTIYVNPTVRTVLGVDAADYIGKTKAQIGLPPQMYEPWDATCRRALENGQTQRFELSFVAPDGSPRHLLARIVPEFATNGSVESLLTITTDVTEQKRAERALAQSELRFRQFAENTNDVLWVFNVNENRLEYVSRAYDAIWGRDHRELLTNRHAWVETVHPDDLESALSGMPGAVELGTKCVEYRILRPDGSIRWITDSGFAIRDETGEVFRVAGIAQDVTERKHGEIELKQAKDAAEAADRAKDQFLAVLSHELRTPLTPVLAAVEMLQGDTTLPAQAREDLEMIRRNIELEARLIDDLLDLTRVARGKIDLQLQPIDAHVAVRRAVETCEHELHDKGLMLRFEPRAERATVIGDSARIQQVVWNLLKNAIKFTPRGGEITIRTAIEPSTCNGNAEACSECVAVHVIDTGIGIESEMLGRIFDAFEQGGRAITRKFGGLGLGLAISKTLADLHNGELTAHSDGADRGATFTLRLPLAPLDALQPQPEAPMAPLPQRDTPVRILLVEDHEDTAKIMARILRSNRYDVRTAGNVASALEIAGSENFDLIISDLGLPDGSGLDLMRQLLDRRGDLKGIALSGFGMEQDLQRSREAGFLDHLIKPVDLNRLESVIRRVMASVVPVAEESPAEASSTSE
jgi:PAS domain S-box-containing protein